jgi:uncharacterized OB-fold protein
MAALSGQAHRRFQEALAGGSVLLPLCLSCDQPFFYPRQHCPRCFGDRISFEPIREPLRVRSFAWVWRPQSRAKVVSLPVLMIAATSDHLSLFAEGSGWSEADPPVIGENVNLTVAERGDDAPVAVLRRSG